MNRLISLSFLVGVLIGCATAFLLGELITRISLPKDLEPFLAEASPRSGVYRVDPELGVDYRSVDDFRSEYRERLAQLDTSNQAHRTWAWFGNSFVQAHGMLGDMAQRDHPEIRMFYLQQNSDLPLHIAQMRLLLESGLKPERIVLVLPPLELLPLLKQPLASMSVNSCGAIVYRWRPPPEPFEDLIKSSHLALLAWIRSGRHAGNPSFLPSRLTEELPPSIKQDLAAIFRVLGRLSRQYNIPVTVLVLPNREQIFGKGGYAPQDYETELCRRENLDYLDTRDLFKDESDKLSLFLADWHFTDKANRLVLDQLYQHWRQQSGTTSRP